MRTIGYKPAYFQPGAAPRGGEPRPDAGREVSIVRQIGRNDYPRFHCYIKTGLSDKATLHFNIHLDQKKPSYEGQTGHSGDYDGPVVESESERIQQILNS